MGSNPPIKSIPTSVAEPNKHIAAYLHSVRPFTVDFANRGVEYFTRSRAGGDVLSEEDWKRDYYDVPNSSRQRRPQIVTSGAHHGNHHHVNPPHHHPSSSSKRESIAKPGPLPFPRRYSANRATPYMRRSLDVGPPSSYNTNTPIDKAARRPYETRDRDAIASVVDSEVFGFHLQNALHRAATGTQKRLPALPISPPPETKPTTNTSNADARRERESLRRSVPTKNANAVGNGVKLDALQVAMQRPSRLSLPRSGILARGVMSQPVKVSSPYNSHYEIDPMQHDNNAAFSQQPQQPQHQAVGPTDLHPHHHPGSRRIVSYGATSPYSAEYAVASARSAPWSPWVDSPASQQQISRYGIMGPNSPQWIDEIGSLYGLHSGTDDRPAEYWYPSPDTHTHQGRPTSLNVDVDTRRYGRPVSAPLPEGRYDTIPEGSAMYGSHHLEASPPSMTKMGSLSPIAGGTSGGGDGNWGPRSDSHNGGGGHPTDWSMPPPIQVHGYSWRSNDPVTPVSPSEEVITFGWAPAPVATPKSSGLPSGLSALEHYYWPSSAGGLSGAAKRESSLPALNTLSLQSPPPFSPYFPSPSDYGREVHAQMY